MIALLRAEALKLSRQPSVLFWGFFAVPFLALVLKSGVQLFALLRLGQAFGGPAELVRSAADALATAGNPVAQLIYAIGIASLFHLEYRHATWRLLVPRRSRPALWAAKTLVCLACLAVSLVLLALADVIVNLLAVPFAKAGRPAVVFDADGLPTLAVAWGIAFLELAVLTAFVSAVAIATRSMIAAVLPAFLLAVATPLVQFFVAGSGDVIPLPAWGADMLRAWLLAGDGGNAGAMAGAGLAVLLAWLTLGLATGFLVLLRQELSTE